MKETQKKLISLFQFIEGRLTKFFRREPERLSQEVDFVQNVIDLLLSKMEALKTEIDDNNDRHNSDIRTMSQQMMVMNRSLLQANDRRSHAESNYQFRIDQLIECKKLLRETELKYYECIVPNFKQNGSYYAQSGSLLAAIDVEHPSIAKMLATSDSQIICSSKR